MTIQQIKSEIRSAKMMLKANPNDQKEQAKLKKFEALLDSESNSPEPAKSEPAKAKQAKAELAKVEQAISVEKPEDTSEKKTE